MARIKIDLPLSFSFSTRFPVRITDLNYGGHAGNDTVLAFIHEARVRFLKSLGYSELDFAGTSLIMVDAALVFKKEIFYGDELKISVAALDFSGTGFNLVYKLESDSGLSPDLLAVAKTGMACYDYRLKKPTALPDAAKDKLTR